MTQMLNTMMNFPGIIRFEDRRLVGPQVSERCKQGRLLSKTSTIARQGHTLKPSAIGEIEGDYLPFQFELVMNYLGGELGIKAQA